MTFGKINYYSIIFILTTIALFILNNDRKDPENLLILNSLLAFFTLIFIALIPKCIQSINRQNSKTEIFTAYDFIPFYIIATAVLLTLVVREYVVIHFIYLIIAAIIIKSKLTISRQLIKFTVMIVLISIAIQLAIFRAYDGRFVLSHLDPNYSGMMLFLFSSFVHYSLSKRLAFLVFLMGFIFLSRNYLLVVAIFYLCLFLNSNAFFHRLFKLLIRPAFVFLFVTLLPLLINLFFISNFDIYNTEILTLENKFTTLQDRSSLDRSLANILFIDNLVNFPSKYILGTDTKMYVQEIFRNTPHHSFLALIINYGLIFSIPYIYYFLHLAHNACKLDNSKVPFYIACMFYMMILGGLIWGFTLIFLSFVLKESKISTHDFKFY